MRTSKQHCESQRKYKATHLEEQRASFRNWYQAVGKERALAVKAEEIKREVAQMTQREIAMKLHTLYKVWLFKERYQVDLEKSTYWQYYQALLGRL